MNPPVSHKVFALTFLLCTVLLFGATVAGAERIKDLANVAGVRSNQLLGYGLVVGLDGSGDRACSSSLALRCRPMPT